MEDARRLALLTSLARCARGRGTDKLTGIAADLIQQPMPVSREDHDAAIACRSPEQFCVDLPVPCVYCDPDFLSQDEANWCVSCGARLMRIRYLEHLDSNVEWASGNTSQMNKARRATATFGDVGVGYHYKSGA